MATTTTAPDAGRILLAGGSGLLGGHLRTELERRGVAITRLTRSRPESTEDAVGSVRWQPQDRRLPADLTRRLADGEFSGVVNLAGSPIARPWLPQVKRTLRSSRIDTTATLAQALAEHAPGVPLVTMSGIGAYGTDCGERVLTEDSPIGDGFLAELVRDWEGAAGALRDAGGRTVHLRSGMVLSPDAPAFKGFAVPAKLGVGTVFGSGRQFTAFVSIDDWVRTVLFVLDRRNIDGPVNVCTPEPARQVDFAAALAHEYGHKVRLRVPAFVLRLTTGGFAWELVGSKRALPQRLMDAGFEFADPTLDEVIEAVAR